MSAGTVRSRFDGFRRYAALIADQHRALDDGDFDRFTTLAAEREALARAIERVPPAPPDAALRELINHCVLEDDRLRRRIAALRDQTRDAICAMDERTPDVHGYLNAVTTPTTTLDVRS